MAIYRKEVTAQFLRSFIQKSKEGKANESSSKHDASIDGHLKSIADGVNSYHSYFTAGLKNKDNATHGVRRHSELLSASEVNLIYRNKRSANSSIEL